MPCCIHDEITPKPVKVSARDRIAVFDVLLVAPALRALIVQSSKRTGITSAKRAAHIA
jgi:hypothetical protein